MEYRSNRRAPASLENLENRVLFSIIQATDYGAAPDDGRDDGAAIQRAIDNAEHGDTVRLAPGTYHAGERIDLAAGVTLDGQRRKAQLKFTGDDGSVLYVAEDDVTIKGLEIEGQVKAEHASNFTFTSNYITNGEGGAYDGNGLYLADRIEGSTIRWNHFDDIGHRGVYFLNQDEMVIEDNLFTDCYQAVSGHFFGTSSGSSVSFNEVTGIRRHGIELQNGRNANTRDLRVEGNYIHSPNVRQGSMFLSLAMGTNDDRVSRGMVVRDNVLVANGNIPEKFDGEWRDKKYMSTAMELMGSDFLVEDNFAAGFGWYQLVGNNDGKWLSRENTFVGTDQVPASAGIGAQIGGEVAPEHGYSVAPSQLRNDIRNLRAIEDVEVPSAGIRRGDAPPTEDRGDEREDRRDDRRQEEVDTDTGGEESTVHLSDLSWISAVNGWGNVEFDTNNGERASGDGSQMKIRGKKYDKGLGVAVNSQVVYELDGKYQRFFSEIGIDDHAGGAGSMRFQVWADGKRIYDSSVMTGRMSAKALDLNVKGVRELKLITTDGADGGNNDHGNWANAQLTRA